MNVRFAVSDFHLHPGDSGAIPADDMARKGVGYSRRVREAYGMTGYIGYREVGLRGNGFQPIEYGAQGIPLGNLPQ